MSHSSPAPCLPPLRGPRGWLIGLAALLAGCGGGAASPTAPAAPGPAASAPSPTAPAANDPASEVVVMLKLGQALEPLLQRYALKQDDQFGRRPIYRLQAASTAAAATAVAGLRGETGVQFAEVNGEVASPESVRAGSVWTVGSAGSVPADQYASALLGLPAAHAVSQGAGVRVAVLDTGADLAHPQLAARWARDGRGAVLGRDFVDDDATPAEEGSRSDIGWGHGTHVAGLVALAAPAAQLMPVRVLDRQGQGNAWVLAEALLWAVDPDGDPSTDDGAHVINLSLGSTMPTNLLKLASELASCEYDDDDDELGGPGFADDRARCAARGRAIVVSAAGNSGSELERIYPAAEQVKGTVSVTASTAASTLAPFANRGSWILLAAPGADVLSTVPGGGYGSWSGTSMAAPLAAGTAALVLATLPPGGDPALPSLRQWLPEAVVKRLTDRPVKLCGTSFLQLHAGAAVKDQPEPDPVCP